MLVFSSIILFFHISFINASFYFPINSNKIYKRIVFLNIIILFSYLLNLNNINTVSQVFTITSGDSPSYLYAKLFFKGLTYVTVISIAFLSGYTLFSSIDSFGKLCKILFVLFAINSFADVLTWLIETNGQIGRYNFLPPITGSAGISIHFSSIGFIFGLSVIKNETNKTIRVLYRFLLLFLFLGVLIILTRKSQMLFVFMYFMYSNLKQNRNQNNKFLFAILIIAVFSIIISFVSSFEAFDSYSGFLSKESQDIEMRAVMIASALDLFNKYPIWGVGYGMFVGHNLTPVYNNDLMIFLGSPHNGFAAILCELGLLGIIAYLSLNITILKQMYSAQNIFKVKYGAKSFYFISAFIVLVGSSISFLYSNSVLYGPPNELTYINLAFINFLIIGGVSGNMNKIKIL